MSNSTSIQGYEIDFALERMQLALQDEAAARAQEVAKGVESPQLAALMVQRYGYGMGAALNALNIRAKWMAEVDALVASIDPQWEQTMRHRWASRPAGLSLTGAAPDA